MIKTFDFEAWGKLKWELEITGRLYGVQLGDSVLRESSEKVNNVRWLFIQILLH